jgi:hypothetical protein
MRLPAGVAAALQTVDEPGDGAGRQTGQLGQAACRHRPIAGQDVERLEVGRAYSYMVRDSMAEEHCLRTGVAQCSVERRLGGRSFHRSA